MTEIHVITAENKSIYADVLENFFRTRHDVFVGERGWSAIAKPDGLERDDYDDDQATYLIAIDGNKIVGGQRLRPTTTPHILQDIFPHLAAVKGIPIAPEIWEWSRYFVVRERRSGRTDCRLLAGIQQYALEENISQLQAIVETWWLPRWTDMGFRVHPLGLPTQIEGQWCIAALIDISVQTLRAVSEFAGIQTTLIRRGSAARIETLPLVS